VQEYRHTAVGIGREVVGERFAASYRTEIARGGGGAAEEVEEPATRMERIQLSYRVGGRLL
jgi:hypothetical protein